MIETPAKHGKKNLNLVYREANNPYSDNQPDGEIRTIGILD